MKKCMMFLTAAIYFLSFPAFADKCGKKDRVSLPSCVSASKAHNSNTLMLNNNCREAVTIKVDKPGSDHMYVVPGQNMAQRLPYWGRGEGPDSQLYYDGIKKTIGSYNNITSTKYSDVRNVYCCPRYPGNCNQK